MYIADNHAGGGETITGLPAVADLFAGHVAGDDGNQRHSDAADKRNDMGGKGSYAGDQRDDGESIGMGGGARGRRRKLVHLLSIDQSRWC